MFSKSMQPRPDFLDAQVPIVLIPSNSSHTTRHARFTDNESEPRNRTIDLSQTLHRPFTEHSQIIHRGLTDHSQSNHRAFTDRSQRVHSALTDLLQNAADSSNSTHSETWNLWHVYGNGDDSSNLTQFETWNLSHVYENGADSSLQACRYENKSRGPRLIHSR